MVNGLYNERAAYMIKKALLFLSLFTISLFAIEDLTMPNTYVDSALIEAADFNEDGDTLEAWTGRLVDTLDSRFIRTTYLESGDSTLTRANIDTIGGTTYFDTLRGNFDIDSISGNPVIDSIQGNPIIDSADIQFLNTDTIVGAPVCDSILDLDLITGAPSIDSITVNYIFGAPSIDSILSLDLITGAPSCDSIQSLDYVTGNPAIDSATVGYLDPDTMAAVTVTGNIDGSSIKAELSSLEVDTIRDKDALNIVLFDDSVTINGNMGVGAAPSVGIKLIAVAPDSQSTITTAFYGATLSDATNNRGVMGLANGGGGTNNIGIYGEAANATNNYHFYDVAGNYSTNTKVNIAVDTLNVDGSIIGDRIVYDHNGELTISSGVITVTGSYHTIDTEGNAAVDTLMTITHNLPVGQMIILHTAHSNRDVLVTDGNAFRGEGSFLMDSAEDILILMYTSLLGELIEISRSNNNQ
jgi:hypothetical protein